MTTKDILVGFGGIDSDLVLAAAPSEKFLKEKRVKNAPADRQTARFIKLGAIAAAIILMICSVPMLLDLTPSDDFVAESYTEVLAECDLAVFGTYKGKTEKLTYSEYTFEVTEVLKGEVTQKEITVRSEKKSIFSEDEMEKHAQSVNASFEEGNEYFLTLQGEGEKVIEFLTEQIVNTADLASANLSDDLRRFLEENGITIEASREDLTKFFKYIFDQIPNTTKPDTNLKDSDIKTTMSGLQLKSGQIDAVYMVTGYVGNKKHVEIPKEYKGYPIVLIEERAFKNTNIESIVFNDYIIVEEAAFFNCASLKNVTFKNGCYIGLRAFSQCTSLEKLTIEVDASMMQNSDSFIGTEAFYNCRSLKLAMLDPIRIIDDYAFFNCQSLEDVILSPRLAEIGKDAFERCNMLKHMEYNNVNYIGSRENPYMVAISAADKSVTSITFSEDTKFILEKAFMDAKNLEEVTFSSNVSGIGQNAFKGCDNLKKVNIPDVNQWCSISFGNAEANPIYLAGNVYSNGELITDLTLSVYSVRSFAFAGATCLQSADFSNVLIIEKDAFSGCQYLIKIRITPYIREIKYGAFGSALDLRKFSDWKPKVYGGILEKECDEILKKCFEKMRK